MREILFTLLLLFTSTSCNSPMYDPPPLEGTTEWKPSKKKLKPWPTHPAEILDAIYYNGDKYEDPPSMKRK